MDVAVSRRVVVLVLPLTLALAGCNMSMDLSARATDEWTHTYPLSAGGEVRITNTNGKIDVEGVDDRRSRSGPSASPAAPPMRRRGSCCRESSSRKTSSRIASHSRPSG